MAQNSEVITCHYQMWLERIRKVPIAKAAIKPYNLTFAGKFDNKFCIGQNQQNSFETIANYYKLQN